MTEFTPRSERRLYKATLVTSAEGPALTNVSASSTSSSSSSSSKSSKKKSKGKHSVGRGMEKAAYLQALKVQRFESLQLKT